jgi:hypothetical protein
MPYRNLYSADELVDLVLSSGLSREEAAPHMESQVRRVGQNQFDIFNMEGFPNEHVTSTGITDCPSDFAYDSCPVSQTLGDPFVGVRICNTNHEGCTVPNADKFESFFGHFDVDGDDVLTSDELVAREAAFAGSAVDTQTEVGVSGTISGAFTFMMSVFTRDKSITKADLRTLLIDRRYPQSFPAFGLHACDGLDHAIPVPRLFADGSSGQFGIQSSIHGGWLNVRGTALWITDGGATGRPSGSLWTATLRAPGCWQFRSSTNGFLLAAEWEQLDNNMLVPPDTALARTCWNIEQVDAVQSRIVMNGNYLAGPKDFPPRTTQSITPGDTLFQFKVCDFLSTPSAPTCAPTPAPTLTPMPGST